MKLFQRLKQFHLVTPAEENDNPEIAQIALAIAGLGILFGAVYGIKQKVDDNSRQISINRDTIRKKINSSNYGRFTKRYSSNKTCQRRDNIEKNLKNYLRN